MNKRINKIPPISGSPDAKIEQIRVHANRIVDELLGLLAERDREIERLRREIENNERK